MTTPNDAGSHGGLLWWRDVQEPGRFTYLPEGPEISRDVEGRLEAALTSAGDYGFLALTARWEPSSGGGESLRDHLATRFGLAPDEVVLTPHPATAEEATLERWDGTAWVPLARSSTSGTPPWVAALGGSLTGDALEDLKAALHGESGRVRLRYRVRREVPVRVKGVLSGRVEELLRSEVLTPQQLEAAVGNRTVQLRLDPSGRAPDALRAQVRSELLQRGADGLQAMARSRVPHPDEATLNVEVEREAKEMEVMDLTRDLAAWFHQERGGAAP